MTEDIDDILMRQQEETKKKRTSKNENERLAEQDEEIEFGQKYWHERPFEVNEQFKAGGNGHNKRDKKEKDGKESDKGIKKITYIQKHSENNILGESVIVDGIPYFAVAQQNTDEINITLEKSIQINETSEYRPYEREAYLNKPYTFKSKEEFVSTIEKAKHESLDSLYKRVKAIWNKYIDADDFHISICVADTIFTYYQDKIGMTHYLFFVGNNGSGKSNNLLVLKFLAYRNFTSTDMTAANIYQFLGDQEEGQGTLCEDEADRIDEDKQKMAIYKNGYITGFPVARTDTSNGRKQLKLNTFGLKAFAAERFPDSLRAKGFNQRVIEMNCYYGNPQEDIAEIANPAGAKEFQGLLDELEETRNLLLAYRLLHYNEKIPDIKLNLKGREKQLFKPVLRIFQNSETLKDLLPVISNYVKQKREANDSTFNAFLYKAIVEIIKEIKTSVVPSSVIWHYIMENLEATEIPGRNLSCETTEFGYLTQKDVTHTLIHVFGAKTKRVNGVRSLAFDVAKLQRLGKIYDLAIEVQVIKEESSSEKSVPDLAVVTDIWNGKGLESCSDHEEIKHEIEPKKDVDISTDPSNVSQAATENLGDSNDSSIYEVKKYGLTTQGKEGGMT